MEVRSSERVRELAHQHGWSLAYGEGFLDGETSRVEGEPPSQYALIGFDEYSLGYRAGYFERQNPVVKHGQKTYWRYTRANGWVVRDPRSSAVACPQCNCRAFRISRRFIDRMVSTFLPVRRYQCESKDCRWEGNLPIRPDSKMARIAAVLKRPFRIRARRPYAAGRDQG